MEIFYLQQCQVRIYMENFVFKSHNGSTAFCQVEKKITVLSEIFHRHVL